MYGTKLSYRGGNGVYTPSGGHLECRSVCIHGSDATKFMAWHLSVHVWYQEWDCDGHSSGNGSRVLWGVHTQMEYTFPKGIISPLSQTVVVHHSRYLNLCTGTGIKYRPAHMINISWQSLRHHLTHWGRVTLICVGNLTVIGSDNGLSPGRRQAIIWTNDGILLIKPLGTNFSEI